MLSVQFTNDTCQLIFPVPQTALKLSMDEND